MASTLRTIFWACIMLVAVLSVCSLLAVDILRPAVKRLGEEGSLKECDRCIVAFDSVSQSMVTFFQTLIMGEGIDDLMIPLIEENWQAAIFILVVVAVVYLGFSNLILSVIVDKANEARCSDAFYQALMAKKVRGQARRELVEVWTKADMDMDNMITLEELRTTYDQQESFRAYFRQMDIDLDFLEMAFEAVDNGSGECNFEEIANSVVQMKNTDVGPVVSVVKHQLNQVMKEIGNLSSQINTLQSDLQDQAEMTKDKFHRTEKTLRKSLTGNHLERQISNMDHHQSGSGLSLLPPAVADMICWSGPHAEGEAHKKIEGTDMDDFDRERSDDLHMGDDFQTRRDKGRNPKKNFIDSKETTRWSRDYRGGWDEGGGGRRSSRPKPDPSEGVHVAAKGGTELAQLQHQAQQIEGDLRNLKSKLASESGNRRAERREDVRVLTEILADIRAQEAQKKREISAAMGTARDVREDRPGRARDSRRRDSRKEMDFAA